MRVLCGTTATQFPLLRPHPSYPPPNLRFVDDDRRKRRRRSSSTSGRMLAWLQKAVSQRYNPGAIAAFADVVIRNPRLALPHISVPDIRWVDWAELRRLGFRGVVFDKDNTLTAPYTLSLWPPLLHSLTRCCDAFPGSVAVFSNSAGLYQYDPDGTEATELEEAIGGIHVIRHELKKPVGTAGEIEEYFACPASLLVMVGDRPFTDVVYGNRNDFLTILTEPLTSSNEPFVVKQVRILEGYLVNNWLRKGLKPANHILLPDARGCIKPPSL